MTKELKPGKFLKTSIIKEYEKRFRGAKSFFVADFGGLTNREIERLKNKLKSASTDYIVVKNSLCRSALKEMKIEALPDMVEGSCAISYTDKDPVAASKVLVDFSKMNEKFKLKGGYTDGAVLSLDTIKELASMPSREVLLTRLVSAMNSPITGFVAVCSGVMKKVLYAINEIIKNKKENEEE
jgi:large subunit ribosomal protein L10